MAKPAARRKNLKDRPNPLDAAGITYIDYKDIALLRRFISSTATTASSAAGVTSSMSASRTCPAPSGTKPFMPRSFQR
jgi:small subunit ribosomal protein S18